MFEHVAYFDYLAWKYLSDSVAHFTNDLPLQFKFNGNYSLFWSKL